MNLPLPDDLEQFVKAQLDAGVYASRGEMVAAALYRLRDEAMLRQAKTEDLRAALDVGIRQLDAGQGKPLDLEEIKRLGRERLAERSSKAQRKVS